MTFVDGCASSYSIAYASLNFRVRLSSILKDIIMLIKWHLIILIRSTDRHLNWRNTIWQKSMLRIFCQVQWEMVILICIVNSENIQLVILHLSVDYLFDILSLILEKLHLSASLMIFIITFNCYSLILLLFLTPFLLIVCQLLSVLSDDLFLHLH